MVEEILIFDGGWHLRVIHSQELVVLFDEFVLAERCEVDVFKWVVAVDRLEVLVVLIKLGRVYRIAARFDVFLKLINFLDDVGVEGPRAFVFNFIKLGHIFFAVSLWDSAVDFFSILLFGIV